MQTIRTITLLMLCLWLAQRSNAQANKHSFIVLLDLSDRLLGTNQVARDEAVITSVFQAFENQVKKKHFIYSKDIFKVAIVPQEGGIDEQVFTQDLYLDLGKLPLSEKRLAVEKLQTNLHRVVHHLYEKATAHKTQANQYKGADIWRYFNDYLINDLRPQTLNHVFILTDGYFDFESNRYVGQQGNRTTDSRMLARLRKLANWESVLASPNEGLIPIKKAFPTVTVSVIEIAPKSKILREQDILLALWRKWLTEMGIQQMNFYVKGNITQTTQRIIELN